MRKAPHTLIQNATMSRGRSQHVAVPAVSNPLDPPYIYKSMSGLGLATY